MGSNHELARWKFGKKYGFIDSTGKTVIEPTYDLTFHFSEGLAAVMVGGKWGYIDTTGKMVIQPMPLMRAEDFHHGLAFVSTKDGRYGYIDQVGQGLVDSDVAVQKLGGSLDSQLLDRRPAGS